MKKTILLSLIINLIFIINLIGTSTNWFRYPNSLETSFIIIFNVLLFLILIIPTHIFFILKKSTNKIIFISILIASCLSLGVYTTVIYQQHGTLILLNHIVKNKVQSIKNQDIQYNIELYNPFSNSHEERLILFKNNKKYIIKLNIFTNKLFAFTSSDDPKDWCTLKTTEESNILNLNVSDYLSESKFLINLQKNVAKKIY